MTKTKKETKLNIKVEKIDGKKLEPGDLFISLEDADYFLPEKIKERGGVAEKVFMRTENPWGKEFMNEVVYRIKIIKTDE